MERNKIKTLGLLSGGLDSTIAVKLMIELGYHVTVLHFMSPFCNCTKKKDSCKSAAHRVAEECEVEIKTVFMGEEYLDIVRAPKYGYGKGLNPCVDCRILMFTRAKRIMEETGARFIFTGEVLSQRPMSQMRNRLNQIEKESGLKGMIVRPLSAALMEPTIPEMEGLIDRGQMLAISGKSRKKQFEIGREMGIDEEYLCSAGGCMLTDLNFAGRMKDLISHSKEISVKDARFLRLGRHFRVAENCKIIVGRNETENEKLEKMAIPGDSILWVKNYPGPCVIVKGGDRNGMSLKAGSLAARYSDAPKNTDVEVEVRTVGQDENNGRSLITVRAMNDAEIESIRL